MPPIHPLIKEVEFPKVDIDVRTSTLETKVKLPWLKGSGPVAICIMDGVVYVARPGAGFSFDYPKGDGFRWCLTHPDFKEWSSYSFLLKKVSENKGWLNEFENTFSVEGSWCDEEDRFDQAPEEAPVKSIILPWWDQADGESTLRLGMGPGISVPAFTPRAVDPFPFTAEVTEDLSWIILTAHEGSRAVLDMRGKKGKRFFEMYGVFGKGGLNVWLDAESEPWCPHFSTPLGWPR